MSVAQRYVAAKPSPREGRGTERRASRLGEIIGNLSLIVNLLVGFAGIILMAMILFGGFRMGTAQGDSQKFESGKATPIQAGIGTLVVMFAAMGGNYFIAQIGSASGAAQVQQVAMQDVAALEAPWVTMVVKTAKAGVIVTFTEPVNVLNPGSVRIGTNNMGTLTLLDPAKAGAAHGKCDGNTALTLASSNITGTSTLTFCSLDSTKKAKAAGTGSTAVQFVMGRGGEIADSDGNNAIVAFAPVPLQ